MQQLHVADVIDIDLFFKHDDQSAAVKLDREDRGREGKLADGGLALSRWRGRRGSVVDGRVGAAVGKSKWANEDGQSTM